MAIASTYVGYRCRSSASYGFMVPVDIPIELHSMHRYQLLIIYRHRRVSCSCARCVLGILLLCWLSMSLLCLVWSAWYTLISAAHYLSLSFSVISSCCARCALYWEYICWLSPSLLCILFSICCAPISAAHNLSTSFSVISSRCAWWRLRVHMLVIDVAPLHHMVSWYPSIYRLNCIVCTDISCS